MSLHVHKYTTSTDLTFYNCRIWSIAERSKFLFRTSPFSAVGRSLAPLCGAYGLLVYTTYDLKKIETEEKEY